MGLSKMIALGSGVTINYHRIVGVNTITNVSNVIEVAGYTSRAKRAEEKAALESGEPMNVYVDTSYIDVPYDQAMTINSAYAYIKELPEYEGATDVLEVGDEFA